MAALTETTSTVTEFSGKYKVIAVEFDGATDTNTITIGEIGTAIAVIGGIKEAPTADCCGVRAAVDGTTTNQINVELIEGDGTPCTQNALDGYVIVIGY